MIKDGIGQPQPRGGDNKGVIVVWEHIHIGELMRPEGGDSKG